MAYFHSILIKGIVNISSEATNHLNHVFLYSLEKRKQEWAFIQNDGFRCTLIYLSQDNFLNGFFFKWVV